jgi:hypothetical protein
VKLLVIFLVILLVIFLLSMAQVRESSAAAAVAVVYGTCSMETLSLVHYPWRRSALLVLSCCCS